MKGQELNIGKLPNEVLETLVLNKIHSKRDEVIVGSAIGEDTAVLDLEDNYIILSCDPITGSSTNIGKLGVHISVNDVSTKGAEPVGILLTLLLPPRTKKEQIAEIMEEVSYETRKLNMDIIGGHTEITSVVNRPVLVATVVGKVNKKQMPDKTLIQEGFIVAMSKTAGLEGTAIIAAERENDLHRVLTKEQYREALEQFNKISVLEEGILSRKYRVGYMHDITEGGVEGAIWEACEAIGKGMAINKAQIPVLESTKVICEHFKINPYKLISSGSMLVVMDPRDFLDYKEDLKRKNIELTQIGLVRKGGPAIYQNGLSLVEIASPGVDDLYKVV